MTVFTVFRQIIGHNGTRTSVPLQVYDKKEDADAAVTEAQQEYAALFGKGSDTQLVVAGRATPIRLPDFLMELGIANIQHTVMGHEVHGALIVQPRSGGLIFP